MKSPIDRLRTGGFAIPKLAPESAILSPGDGYQLPGDFLEFLPCVLYECDFSLQINYLSSNVFELIGVEADKLLGTRALWEQRILPEDLTLLSGKINDLEEGGSVSAVHRIIRDDGLPVWVSHSFRRVRSRGINVIRGYMVPLHDGACVQRLEQGIISRFIHKLGNHFQLLNLVIHSLRGSMPESREAEVLRQTVEEVIELTRTFSDYNSEIETSSIVDIPDIINAVAMARGASFSQKGIFFDQRLDESVSSATVRGDPYLLELAVGGVLQNALEATDAGGTVVLNAKVETSGDHAAVLRLSVADSGCGISRNNLESVKAPFFTTKKCHHGLGLSMAIRFIEMHSGFVTIKSQEGQGTEVEIMLPVEVSSIFPER